jgi:peroxiredoxin
LGNPDSSPQNSADALAQAEKHHASLGARLSSYRDQSRRLHPDVTKAYDELIDRLGVLDRDEAGPQIGERMADFTLPDENGRLISLSSLLQSGPAVVSINRGHWCPYCKLELRAIAAVHDQIKQLGASVVSIMPDSAQFTSRYVQQNALPFPILSDIDLGYALSLGLVFWVGAEVRSVYEGLGIDLEKYQGNQALFLPVAAKFVVGRDGLVKARQVNIEFRERMEPEAIVAALKDLSPDGD